MFYKSLLSVPNLNVCIIYFKAEMEKEQYMALNAKT